MYKNKIERKKRKEKIGVLTIYIIDQNENP